MPVNLSNLPLGKQPAKHDKRTLQLSDYLVEEKLARPPREVAWSGKAGSFPMLLNDKIGCCTIASALHLQRCMAANVGHKREFNEEHVLEGYQRICGYDPKNPDSDTGGIMLDVLNAWRKEGIGGYQIVAFVAINPENLLEVRTAMNLFGGVYAGFALPEVAQNQDVWTPARGSSGARNSWGGHCIPLEDYIDPAGSVNDRFSCVTWGARKQMTPTFVSRYCDEAYAVVSREWLDDQGKSPAGLDLDGLLSDLKKLIAKSKPKAAVVKPAA